MIDAILADPTAVIVLVVVVLAGEQRRITDGIDDVVAEAVVGEDVVGIGNGHPTDRQAIAILHDRVEDAPGDEEEVRRLVHNLGVTWPRASQRCWISLSTLCQKKQEICRSSGP